MAKFKINEGYDDEKEVEAANFREVGSLVIFYSPAKEQVYALPIANVVKIETVSR